MTCERCGDEVESEEDLVPCVGCGDMCCDDCMVDGTVCQDCYTA